MAEAMELDLPEANPPVANGDAEDSGSDIEQAVTINSILKAPERRKIQDACFRQWIVQQAQTSTSRPKKTKSTDNDQLSIRQLIAQHESKPIITEPREYQVELFGRAKQQNTIAVLDTGTGKTLIAVLLLRYTLDQELENRRIGNQARISFFLVCALVPVSFLANFCQGTIRQSRLPAVCRSRMQSRSQDSSFLRCNGNRFVDERCVAEALRREHGHRLHC